MDKILRLSSLYEFEIVVEFDGVQFAGKLRLNPSRIIISIMGEEYNERKFPIHGERVIEKIQCSDFNSTFILFNLTLIEGTNRTITRLPDHIGFCDYVYEADYLVHIPTQSYIENSFSAIRIYSDDITKWIGHTELQSQIIRDYKEKVRSSSLTEFSIYIENLGVLGVLAQT